jgi:hypothetical protein
MSSWKTLRFAVLIATLCGCVMVGALAPEATGGEPVPSAHATLVDGQQPVSDPAPEPPAEPRETPTPKPGRPSPEAKPATRGEQVNVRVDLKIRAQRGSAAPVEKILALVVIGDDSRTAVRTSSSVPFPMGGTSFQYRDLSLNADVRAIVGGRHIRVALTLDYNFAIQATEGDGRASGPTTSSVRNEIRAVLEDGKPLVVSDQVEAASDYRVTVEAKATILR